MNQGFVRNFAMAGVIVWSCLVGFKMIIQFSSSAVMISNEFHHRIYIFDLVVSILIGFSIFLLAAFRKTINNPDNVVQGDPLMRKLLSAIGALIFALAVSWFTYIDFMPSIMAFSFHHAAPKEEISINAEILKVNRAHQKGTYLLKCTYWLNFSEPKLSPFSQYVCINNVQYEYFQRTELPKVVVLHGQKSEYGYELHYSQQHRPTPRALDAGDSARFTSNFLASSFFCSQAESTPAPAPVTQTVSPFPCEIMYDIGK